jgi:non-specific serine/threonine protein kinase
LRLPVPLTSLIGREAEFAGARELLCETGVRLLCETGVRLLTLTGTPGVGKSRLGLELAHELQPDFPDGVHLVQLAALPDPALVGTALAAELDVRDTGQRPVEELLAERVGQRRVLVVLDNFEHLLPAAPFVASLLGACPRLSALATSRAALGVRGEHRLPLAPLEVPDPARPATAADLGRVPAVALFGERARAAQPAFRLDADSAPAVAEIARRLDGLPLALELAAPWIRMLSPDDLLERLRASRLQLLTHGYEDLSRHQQTMRSTLWWSYDLLSDAERAVFRRLCVFAGGAPLEAVAPVCEAAGGPSGVVLDALAGLVDKSLVLRHERDGRPRFRILASIREFGL